MQGFSTFNSEPLLIGISLSSLEKAFSVVDIGPNSENKEEVYDYLFPIKCHYLIIYFCEKKLYTFVMH